MKPFNHHHLIIIKVKHSTSQPRVPHVTCPQPRTFPHAADVRTTAFSRVSRQPAHSKSRRLGRGAFAWPLPACAAVVASPREYLGRDLRWPWAWPPRSTAMAPQPAAVRLPSAFMSNRPPERPRLFVDRSVDRSVLGNRLPSVSRRKASATGVHTTSERSGVCPCLAASSSG